jgi:NAD(P)H-hydrate epimerase
MTDAWTAAQIRAAEKPHLDAGEPLMQRAADGLAGVVRDLLRASSASRGGRAGRVLLLVGSGNNGGDALYAGASLAAEIVPAGGAVTVVPTGSHLHDEALAAALAAGATLDEVGPWADPATAPGLLRDYDVVLDGMVGTGASGGADGSGGLRGDARRVVEALLPSVGPPDAPRVVAVDLPSGLDPDDGSTAADIVLPADVTVTFGGRKAGLLLGRGPALAGRVVLIDIGIGAGLAAQPPTVTLSGR